MEATLSVTSLSQCHRNFSLKSELISCCVFCAPSWRIFKPLAKIRWNLDPSNSMECWSAVIFELCKIDGTSLTQDLNTIIRSPQTILSSQNRKTNACVLVCSPNHSHMFERWNCTPERTNITYRRIVYVVYSPPCVTCCVCRLRSDSGLTGA